MSHGIVLNIYVRTRVLYSGRPLKLNMLYTGVRIITAVLSQVTSYLAGT